jgi:hypothetical protein
VGFRRRRETPDRKQGRIKKKNIERLIISGWRKTGVGGSNSKVNMVYQRISRKW